MHPGSTSSLVKRQSSLACQILLRHLMMTLRVCDTFENVKRRTNHVVSRSSYRVNSIRRGEGRPSDYDLYNGHSKWMHFACLLYNLIELDALIMK